MSLIQVSKGEAHERGSAIGTIDNHSEVSPLIQELASKSLAAISSSRRRTSILELETLAVGTRGDGKDDTRALECAAWVGRLHTSTWLRAAGLTIAAEQVARLAPSQLTGWDDLDDWRDAIESTHESTQRISSEAHGLILKVASSDAVVATTRRATGAYGLPLYNTTMPYWVIQPILSDDAFEVLDLAVSCAQDCAAAIADREVSNHHTMNVSSKAARASVTKVLAPTTNGLQDSIVDLLGRIVRL